jgi:hypothetical protein
MQDQLEHQGWDGVTLGPVQVLLHTQAREASPL